jgi:hypothetical protein
MPSSSRGRCVHILTVRIIDILVDYMYLIVLSLISFHPSNNCGQREPAFSTPIQSGRIAFGSNTASPTGGVVFGLARKRETYAD